MQIKEDLIPIKDFIDFNYEDIAFDITNVDSKALLSKLHQDYVNHLWELEDAKFIAIANCDLQGFHDLSDVYFGTFNKTYKLATLVYNNNEWFYYVTNPCAVISED